ncbi:MAG: PQQ-binding-like beta-propeller repeat protein [Candidatus Baltobacteraceae bacterium]
MTPTTHLVPSAGISSGDWPQYRRDNQRTGNNVGQSVITAGNVSHLALRWKASLPNGAFATPVIMNGSVYIADLAGNVTAFNEATGKQLWTQALGGGFYATPTFSDGKLYAPNLNGQFAVLDAATGALLWQYPVLDTAGSYEGSPIVANGVVYETRANRDEDNGPCISQDQVVTFDANVGQLLSAETLTPTGTSGVGVWSSPMMDASNALYVATGNSCGTPSSPFGDSILHLSSSSLNVIWKFQATDGHDWDFGATPVYLNGIVYDVSKDGYVYALDAESGALLWKNNGNLPNGGGVGSPGTDGKRIFVPFNETDTPTPGGAIFAFNLDGSIAWSHLTGSPEGVGFGTLSAPAVSGGAVYVGDSLPNCTVNCYGLSAYDTVSGQLLWRYPTDKPIYAGAAIVDGGLFVADFEGGTLYHFTLGGT